MKKWIFGMAALAAAMCFGATTEDGVTKERRGALGPNDMVVTDVDATGIVTALTYTKAEVDRRIATNAPVRSVNGKTGRVVLGANDVGALPNNRDGLKANANFRNAVWDVQIKSSGGVDTNAVRDIASEEIVPATNSLNQTLSDALGDKRDLDDLAVYEKVGVGDDWVWTSDDPDLLNALEANGIKPKRVDDDSVGYHFWYTSTSFGDWTTTGNSWDPSYGVDAHIVKFKYESPVLGKFDVTATATRSYKLRPVSPADSLAKVSQLDGKLDKTGGTVRGDFKVDLPNYSGIILSVANGLVSIADGQTYFMGSGGQLVFRSDGFKKILTFDERGNPVTLIDFLDSLAWRTTGNRKLSDYGITNAAPLSMISATNSTFSSAVLAVGLNIDTNSVAVLNEIADTFGGFPIEGTATTVSGLLAALAAAVAWLKKNKVGSFASVGGASATVDNGVAKLDGFFTESNSLLNGRLVYNRNITGLKDRAFNTLSFDGTEYNLSTALAAVTPTASGQPRDLLIVATATAATTISFTAGTIKGDKPTIDGSGTWLITLTEYASGVWYCRQIKMEDAQ